MPPKKKVGKGKKVETPEPDHAGEEEAKAPVNTSANPMKPEWEVERKVVKPPNQLELTEEELVALKMRMLCPESLEKGGANIIKMPAKFEAQRYKCNENQGFIKVGVVLTDGYWAKHGYGGKRASVTPHAEAPKQDGGDAVSSRSLVIRACLKDRRSNRPLGVLPAPPGEAFGGACRVVRAGV